MATLTLSRSQRLKSERAIQDLYARGRSFLSYPLRVVYLSEAGEEDEEGCRIMVSVPKRLFKRAVKRNRLKRLMREAFRLHQSLVGTCHPGRSLLIAFGYIGKEMTDYARIETAMTKALGKIAQQTEPAHEEKE